MASLFDPPSPGSNTPEFSVAELSARLKRHVEENFGHVRVRGEITQPKLHSSGHLYLTLKDEGAVLSAVCWRGQVSRLKVKPEEGMEVVAEGRLTTYPGRSQYQLVIEQMALAGVGALLKMLEARKKKLAAEGLFDEARKKPLPAFPRVIGVITSPTGAVIRDILHRIAERFPCRVLIWPVAVQGEGAALQVANALAGFNALPETGGAVPRPDVLIVARGGGSLEDMLPFYEEIVVRAAAASRIPLISAIGHETDTCLMDYAADRRAPTPTAAAEMAVPVRRDLLARVRDMEGRLSSIITWLLETLRLKTGTLAGRLTHPRFLLETLTQKLDDRTERLRLAGERLIQRRHEKLQQVAAGLSPRSLRQQATQSGEKLQHLAQRLSRVVLLLHEKRGERLRMLGALLESASYTRILQRGFALVRDEKGHTVTHAKALQAGQTIDLTFADGTAKTRVES